MPDFKDPQDKQDIEEVRNKQQIKSIIYYLVKQAGWSSEYNSYKLASHLIGTLKAVTDYKYKAKYKRKEAKAAGKALNTNNKVPDSGNKSVSHRQA